MFYEERGKYKITPEQQAEKEACRARLRAFLEDPAARQIEGFPIGEIEDILALSDPPLHCLPQSLPAGSYCQMAAGTR